MKIKCAPERPVVVLAKVMPTVKAHLFASFGNPPVERLSLFQYDLNLD